MDEVAQQIIQWGKEHCADFPWRHPETPYESAVAEILLIRTPPEQILPVYQALLDDYPTVARLNEASQQEIFHRIESLGLRWRAERLGAMAQYIVEVRGGEFPRTLEGLQDVPGIGFYAASAIMLFAYRKRAFLVDANSVRFIERYYCRTFSGEARRNKQLIAAMDELTPDNPATAIAFAEGFLDFMRDVCRPVNPLCNECCLSDGCRHCHMSPEGT